MRRAGRRRHRDVVVRSLRGRRAAAGGRQRQIDRSQWHTDVSAVPLQQWVHFNVLQNTYNVDGHTMEIRKNKNKNDITFIMFPLIRLYILSWCVVGGAGHVNGERAIDRSLDMCASCGCRGTYDGTCAGEKMLLAAGTRNGASFTYTCSGLHVVFGCPKRPCGGLCPDIARRL